MPGLGDYLYDLINPQDAGAGMGASPNVRQGFIEGQRMPPDPRMLAYMAQQAQQPPPPQLAQQAPQNPQWGDPMSGMVASAQQPQLPQPEGPSWADAFYKLIAPGMGGTGSAGPRY